MAKRSSAYVGFMPAKKKRWPKGALVMPTPIFCVTAQQAPDRATAPRPCPPDIWSCCRANLAVQGPASAGHLALVPGTAAPLCWTEAGEGRWWWLGGGLASAAAAHGGSELAAGAVG